MIIDEITNKVIDIVNKTEIESQKNNLQDNWEIFASFIELDMKIKEILPTVNNSNYGDHGYFLVVDKKGIVLAHGGDNSAIGKPIKYTSLSILIDIASNLTNGCVDTTTKVHELHSESVNIVKLVERFTV